MDVGSAYLGEIGLWTGSFIPRNWAACNGQLLLIAHNNALFALLGTTYGGDGKTTFALPDLQGRTAVGASAGTNGYPAGTKDGQEQVTLITDNLPNHSHQIWATDALANAEPPLNAIPGTVNGTVNKYYVGAPDVVIAPNSLAPAGGGQPHDNIQPYLAMTYVICTAGLFPA